MDANKTYQRLLVATDFSDGSDAALAEAVKLAKPLNATIDLVHVLDRALQEFPVGLGFYTFDPGGYLAYAHRALEMRAETARAAGLTCGTRTLEGRPAVEIVRRAIETEADLVVLGTHGRTGLSHALIGSVAERVVRHAGCPVLTVPFPRPPRSSE